MVDLTRQVIVIILTVAIVLFYQYYEDKKNKIKREDVWSMLKMPILMGCLVYLAMNLKMPKSNLNSVGGSNVFLNESPENIYTELPNW
jgi:hypothetical protein